MLELALPRLKFVNDAEELVLIDPLSVVVDDKVDFGVLGARGR